MKIVLVTQHYAPHFEGGTESVVRAQARGLAALGHEVAVLSGTDRAHAGSDVVEDQVDGLRVRFLPRLPEEPYSLLLERERLAPLVTDLVADADLVHVHHWSTLHGRLVRDLAARRPVVVSLHDFFSVCPRFFRLPVPPVEACPTVRGDIQPCVRCVAVDAGDLPVDVLRDQLTRRLTAWGEELAAAAALVVPSSTHATNLAVPIGLPVERFHVVGHGHCTAVPREDVALDWDGDGDLRVLFLGHLGAVKGITDLVDALAALPDEERSRIVLTCLGEAVEAGIEDDLRRRGADVRLELGGGFEPADLPRRIRAAGGAHLAALPSRAFETYGLVVDEAFALGLPVWVSDRGAPPTRIGDAGRVLSVADPAAWSRALSDALRNPGMLRSQRAAVAGRLRTAEDAVRDLDALYRSLLDQ